MVEQELPKKIQTRLDRYSAIENPSSVFNHRRRAIIEESVRLVDGRAQGIEDLATRFNTPVDTMAYVIRSVDRQLSRVSRGLAIRRV